MNETLIIAGIFSMFCIDQFRRSFSSNSEGLQVYLFLVATFSLIVLLLIVGSR